ATRAGYEAWLYNSNIGSYDEFIELWGEQSIKELLSDAYELLQQLNSEQLREVINLIESRYL
ncbi:unnamed protein product, partial [marine sediment metagenome]